MVRVVRVQIVVDAAKAARVMLPKRTVVVDDSFQFFPAIISQPRTHKTCATSNAFEKNDHPPSLQFRKSTETTEKYKLEAERHLSTKTESQSVTNERQIIKSTGPFRIATVGCLHRAALDHRSQTITACLVLRHETSIRVAPRRR